MMQALFLKPQGNVVEHKLVSLADSGYDQYQQMLKYLDCECLGHCTINVHGKVFDLFFDDCGKFCQPAKQPSVLLVENNKLIDYVVGNTLVCICNGDDKFVGLSDKDIQDFLYYTEHCRKIVSQQIQEISKFLLRYKNVDA